MGQPTFATSFAKASEVKKATAGEAGDRYLLVAADLCTGRIDLVVYCPQQAEPADGGI